MKATDLRLGNFVSLNGRIVEVESLNDFGINLSCESTYYGGATTEYEGLFETTHHYSSDEIASAIPLTQQWLNKFDFSQDHNTWATDYFILGEEIPNEFRYASSVRIHYVHQLQNIYFIITGRELSLKSKK